MIYVQENFIIRSISNMSKEKLLVQFKLGFKKVILFEILK